MVDTKAPTTGMDGGEIERERALFDGLKESASEVLDLFTGVDQSDVAAGRVDLDELSREDRIELIVVKNSLSPSIAENNKRL